MTGPPPGPEAAARSGRFDFRAVMRVVLLVVPIGVLGNLVFTFLATDRQLLSSLDRLPKIWLAVALMLALVPWATNTLRLLIWTRFLGYRLPLLQAYRMTLAVELGAAASPTAVGGGFLKWGMLVQRGVSPGTAASITALPKLEDAVFFAVALPTALTITAAWELREWAELAGRAGPQLLLLILLAAAVFGAASLLLWLLLRGLLGGRVRHGTLRRAAGVRRRLRGAWRDARDVFGVVKARGKSRFALTLLLTAIQWTARYSVITALVAFLGAPVSPVLFFALQWVVFTLMNLVPTPGATGGAEVAFAAVFGALVPAGVLGVTTAGWRFLTFYLQVGLGAVLFPLLGRWDDAELPWDQDGRQVA